ncbi:MAG TPA: dehydrogenase [Mycobacterium sp.]|uniref:dehydrogenase n=1 Tax=Mycobacterium sp. TaxID=1785 RepID=UPI002D3BF72F|nr:dehydrogenase [Mycobacterium sp.]HZU50180.1 dehydrogenase [Mycobacterium sp.]
MAVDLPSSPLAAVDPEFEKMALETGEFTFGLSGTNIREKLLQNLAQDVCRSHLGLAFHMHITAAKMYGISYPDMLAVIRFTAPYSGYPAAADALARLQQVAQEIGLDTDDVGDPGTSPRAAEAAETFDINDEWMRGFLNSRIARASSEHRLNRREQIIIAITCDVSQQTLGDTFRRHLTLALEAGVSIDDLRDIIRFCAEHSVARATSALRELDRVLSG